MTRPEGQDLTLEPLPADITRREALKKIGQYGVYVPATLAVLKAAPRAFAQSQTCDLYLELRVETDVPDTNPWSSGPSTYASGTHNESFPEDTTPYAARHWDVQLKGNLDCLGPDDEFTVGMSDFGNGLTVHAGQSLPFQFPLRASNSFFREYNRADGAVIFDAAAGHTGTWRVRIISGPPSANPIDEINVNVSTVPANP